MKCPECQAELTQVGQFWICPRHGQISQDEPKPFEPMRIFFSYGHDHNEELVRLIKTDLEKRGHNVWFDKNEIHGGDDWRHTITDGILKSHRVISFLSKHSTRDPGVCLDEIAIAIGVKGGNLKTILLEPETEVSPPPTISHIQWMDMQDWQQRYAAQGEQWQEWYKEKLDEIIRVVESDESRQFAGEIEKLSGHLRPISSDSRISSLLSRGFVGREWLFEAVEKWCQAEDQHDSRLFWLMGAPGVGKSAFAAQLCHFGRDRIIAAQFCEWDKADHRNARRVVRSLAFQLAARLPDYRKLLLTLPEISQLDNKTETELFDYLLAEPLASVIDGGRGRYLIMIDALDEAAEGEHNPLVQMLAREAKRLPDWLGLIITSRPEKSVTTPLQGLNPYILDTKTETNKNDIRRYLQQKLALQLKIRSDAKNIVEYILDKSESLFLYVERVCDDINKGHLSLDRLEEFPQGLGEIFWQFFERQFPDQEKFKKEIRPTLRAILAACEPLPLELLQELFKWPDEELRDFTHALGSLFPITKQPGRETIRPYHKSIIDWLDNADKAGPYYVSIKEGHSLLATSGFRSYQDNLESLNLYFIHNLPTHLIENKMWDEVTNTLCNLLFLQMKTAKLGVQSVNFDYLRALSKLQETKNSTTLNLYHKLYLSFSHKYDRNGNNLVYILFGQLWWREKEIAHHAFSSAEKYKKLQGCFLRQYRKPIIENSLMSTSIAISYSAITNAEVSKCNKKLAIIAYRANKVQLWNIPTQKELISIVSSKKSTAARCRFSENGNHLFTLWDNGSITNTIVDTKLTTEIQLFEGISFACSAFSYDGNRLAIAFDDIINIYCTETGKLVKKIDKKPIDTTACEFSQDGRNLAIADEENIVTIIDIIKASVITTLHGHENRIVCCSFSYNGKQIVTAGFDKTIRIWKLPEGECTHKLSGHIETVLSCSFSANSIELVSGGMDSQIILWNLHNSAKIAKLEGHKGGVSACHFLLLKNSFISCGHDGIAKIWQNNNRIDIASLSAHTDRISSCCLSPSGDQIITGSWDKTIGIWKLTDGSAKQRLKGHEDKISEVRYNDYGILFSRGRTGKLYAWSPPQSKPLKQLILPPNNTYYRCMATSPDNILVALAIDNTLVVVQKENKNIIWQRKIGGIINEIVFTSKTERVISGGLNGSIKIWNSYTGEPIASLTEKSEIDPSYDRHKLSPVTAMATSSVKSHLATGNESGHFLLWSLDSNKLLGKYPCQTAITSIIFLPKKDRIAVGDDEGNLYFLQIEYA